MNNIISFDKSKDDMEIGRFSFRFNGFDEEGKITFCLGAKEQLMPSEKAAIIHLPTFISNRNIAFQD